MKIVRFILLLLLISVLFLGCQPEETKTVEERISEFLSDIRSNRWGELWTHLHPSNALRDAKSSSEWNPSPFPNGTWGFTGISGGGSTRTVEVTASPGGALEQPGDRWTFEMREDTKDLWYIDGLTTDSGASYGFGGGVIIP